MTEKISIYEMNTSPENLAHMSPRDARIIKAVSHYAKEIEEKRLTFKDALKFLMTEFKSDEPNGENPITQWVKPPLVVMTARTNKDLHWTPKSGEKQILKAGGHIMLSYNKLSKVWDIWGVADDAIPSYSCGVEPTNEIPQYLEIYGKMIDINTLPKIDVEYSFGKTDESIKETPFVFAVKAAPAIVFFAESEFDLWGLESTEPYKVKKGTPILIGILFEMWTRKIADFQAAYLRVDDYAVKSGELLELLKNIMAIKNLLPANIYQKVFTTFTRLTLFSTSSDNVVITTDKVLKYQTITSRIAAVVKPPEEDNSKSE